MMANAEDFSACNSDIRQFFDLSLNANFDSEQGCFRATALVHSVFHADVGWPSPVGPLGEQA